MYVQAHSRSTTPRLTLCNTHKGNGGCSGKQEYEQHIHARTHAHRELTRSVQINHKNLQDGLT